MTAKKVGLASVVEASLAVIEIKLECIAVEGLEYPARGF